MTLRAAVAALALFVLTAATAPAPRDAMLVSTSWLAEQADNPNLVILHVGSSDSYARHIPGARLVRLSDISMSSDAGTLEMLSEQALRLRLAGFGIGDRSRIVVYYAEAPQQATRVVFTLDAAGLGAQTSLLDGGMAAWEREGRPLTAETPADHIGSLSPLKMKKDAVVDAKFVQDHMKAPGYAVIDARIPAFYDGTQTGGSKENPHKTGHIAGAKNVPITALTDAASKISSSAALEALFAKAGVKRGDKLIVYCHTGQQASGIVFAARTLGYDAMLYDGSFEDWSKRDLAVEK
ncbi:MAG: sulfurtransferase [Rhodospirillaceae bacterium]|nr:sulfurtransferase [Rhodospirillaceae bacterium]